VGFAGGQGARGEAADQEQVQARVATPQPGDGFDQVAQPLDRVHEAEERDDLRVGRDPEPRADGADVHGAAVGHVRGERDRDGEPVDPVGDRRGVRGVRRDDRGGRRSEPPGLAVDRPPPFERGPDR
jgi:hypothetical protein